MQERYTKQADNVLALAKQAASSCGHSYIGTEHLLVGLVEEKKELPEECWKNLESRRIRLWR